MIRHEASSVSRFFALIPAVLAVLVLAVVVPSTDGQEPEDPLTKILTNPDRLQQLKKDAERPPLEFSRSQVMPNDVLPYAKANHWSMFALEMRANHDDYEGMLLSPPIRLADQPQEVIYRRDARLVKGQRTRLTMPILLPTIPKEMRFRLTRPEAVREDAPWDASCRMMEPHQQLIVVLTRDSNDGYLRWNSLRSTLPGSTHLDDAAEVERARYYRMVLPLEPSKPLLSPHPLTWTPISHVIWDGLEPEKLNVAQQQALVDWLHWGGQLIVVGGAGPNFATLRDSFLSSYLPADASGDNVTRSGAQLKALSEAYAPPTLPADILEPIAANAPWEEAWQAIGRRYRPIAPILATEKKPLFISALKPRPGATVIPLGGADDPPLGVEWRVGRGRVLMLAVSVSEPDLIGWPGFDTLIRRVILRRPEEFVAEPMRFNQFAGGGYLPPRYQSLVGPDLTGVRYLTRDLGAPDRKVIDPEEILIAPRSPVIPTPSPFNNPARIGYASEMQVPVGEWLDASGLPRLSRERLEEASGIEVPSSQFVLRVIVGYLLALVPLNWLLCRYVFGRREWAWVVAPTLALGVAIVVERAAAYDVGYDSSSNEIDVLETHGDYRRGLLSRFASLYSTGRVKYSISYPGDSTALALPMSTSGSLRGEEAAQSTFQALPTPDLAGFQVQPRSLALFRAEQMKTLPGTVTLESANGGPGQIRNEVGFDLRDAWVVEVRPEGEWKAAFVGNLGQGASLPFPELDEEEPVEATIPGKLSPSSFLDLIRRSSVATRPEEIGELRLIAWSKKLLDGQTIDPPVDRQDGFSLVVAHLRAAPLLDSASARYNARARGEEKAPPIPSQPAATPNTLGGMMGSGTPMMPPLPSSPPSPPTTTPEPSQP